jgi:hypothetical protein
MVDLLGPGDAGAARTLTTTTDVSNPATGDTFFGDCQAGVPGTGTPIVSKFLNRFLQQVRRIIRASGITPITGADDDMLGQALQTGYLNFAGTFGGTANALTATLTPAPALLVAGMSFAGFIATTNTSSAVTLNVNGLGNIAVVKANGVSLPAPGDLQAGALMTFRYDGTNVRIVGLSPSDALRTAGQVRLSVTSATQLTLSPNQGDIITIAGQNQVIPSGGVTLSNSGLAASTVYNVYAYMSSGTPTLEAVTTAHVTDPVTGQEIKSGDSSRTIVGKIATNASAQFGNSAQNNGLINWFNRRGLNVAGPSFTNGTTATSATDLGGSNKCTILAWGDEALYMQVTGYGSSNTSGSGAFVTLGVDGVPGVGAACAITSPAANAGETVVSSIYFTPSEGQHTLSIFGQAQGAGGSGISVTVAIMAGIRG